MTFNELLNDSRISHSTFGNIQLKKEFKSSVRNGFHYLFNYLDQNKNFFDVEIQTEMPEVLAHKSIQNYTNLLFLSYGDQPSPYAGIITNIDKCPNSYTPLLKRLKLKKQVIEFYKSSAGARYQYGVCNKASTVYSVCTLFYYNQERSILGKIKYFTLLNKGDCQDGIKTFVTGLVYK